MLRYRNFLHSLIRPVCDPNPAEYRPFKRRTATRLMWYTNVLLTGRSPMPPLRLRGRHLIHVSDVIARLLQLVVAGLAEVRLRPLELAVEAVKRLTEDLSKREAVR